LSEKTFPDRALAPLERHYRGPRTFHLEQCLELAAIALADAEHTTEVLSELGYSSSGIDALRRDGVIGTRPDGA
jgi:hypothetical protein